MQQFAEIEDLSLPLISSPIHTAWRSTPPPHRCRSRPAQRQRLLPRALRIPQRVERERAGQHEAEHESAVQVGPQRHQRQQPERRRLGRARSPTSARTPRPTWPAAPAHAAAPGNARIDSTSAAHRHADRLGRPECGARGCARATRRSGQCRPRPAPPARSSPPDLARPSSTCASQDDDIHGSPALVKE